MRIIGLTLGILISSTSPGKVPDLSGAIQLMGKDSMAHACPVGPEKAFTAAHVSNEDGTASFYRWQQGEASGVTSGAQSLNSSDLGLLQPKEGRGFPKWYEISQKGPALGEKLWIRGYDFRSGGRAFQPRDWEVHVTRLVAGHIIFDPPVTKGTSGSCILDQSGKVVGVVSATATLANLDDIGIGVGIWGEWGEGL